MKPIPVVGQKLYSLNVGNAARNREQVLTEVEVISVGRKYFKVKKDWQTIEYHLESWREKTVYSPTSVLYEKREIYEKEKEVETKFQELRKHFQWNSLRLPDDVILKMHECLKGD
jgi:hypothetical protein